MPLNGDTLKATWTAITYNITYKLDGGALAEGVTNPATYTIESDAITLANPTKTGYTFAGWTGTDLTAATAEVTIAKGSIGDRRYTATWTVNQYTITFDTDGGSEVTAITADYGSTLTKPADPTKEGYTFAGWDPAFPETMPLNGDTLKAIWTVNTYTITWIVDGQSTEQKVEYGATIEKPADPKKDGYIFMGWTPEVPETMPAENLTFTAQFVLPTGIDAIVGNGQTVNVYTMSGVLVGRNMTKDQVKRLHKGIYIINGKKIVKK